MHEIESIAWTNEVPWHGLGVEVSNDLTADEMLVKAGLDWTVSKRPLYFPKVAEQTTLKLIPNKFALTRDSDESLLDVVGDAYKPVQNADALDFFKRFVDSGDMKMETAGSLRRGQFIWGLAKIQESFNVGVGDEDRVEGYLLLTQPHKFGFSMVAALTPIRVVCMNTMKMALGEKLSGKGRGNTTGVFRMPHSRAFDEEVQKAAEQALGLARAGMVELAEAAELLSKVRINEDDLPQYFHDVVNVELEEDADPDKFSRTIKTLLDAVNDAPGAQLKSAEGTLWGAYNAVTYTADHILGRSDDSRIVSAWFGAGGGMKRRALDLALEIAKAA